MRFGEDLPKDIRNMSKRRGPRMNSRVPVSLEWDGQGRPLQFEPGFTRVVNTYGCLLVSPREVDAQQKLRLTNLATLHEADAVVVWKGPKRSDGWDLGVEFLSVDLNFWGVDL
jgi:hypothetical protein